MQFQYSNSRVKTRKERLHFLPPSIIILRTTSHRTQCKNSVYIGTPKFHICLLSALAFDTDLTHSLCKSSCLNANQLAFDLEKPLASLAFIDQVSEHIAVLKLFSWRYPSILISVSSLTVPWFFFCSGSSSGGTAHV